MMRLVFGFSLIFACAVGFAEVATIRLQDGSTLRGEVVSLRGGMYVIAAPSIGEVSVPQEQVRVVEYGAGATATQPAQPPGAAGGLDLDAVQSRLMGNPGIMSAIMRLQSDPDVQAAVNDPEIQRAISSGDYASLMAHPKIIRLMNNSGVKAITQQVR